MSERIRLSVEPRALVGKKAKSLRAGGWIPAVIYGQGRNLNIQIENLPLRRVLRVAGATNLIDIELNDDKHTVLAREVQKHPTRGDLIHVDFYEVDMKAKIVVEAGLTAVGESGPAAAGLGTVSLNLYSVEIECLPDRLISEIEVDMSLINEPEDMIFVSDLVVPEGVEILADPEAVVARFEFLQAELEEEDEEEEGLMFADEAGEPEVIGRAKKEGEEDEEAGE